MYIPQYCRGLIYANTVANVSAEEMLDYDGSGTVGTDEFCDGVIKA